MCTIVVDDRERAIIDHIRPEAARCGIEIRITRLEIGDYIIERDGRALAIIERKTWTDLSAGIRDGRKENVKKLLYARQELGATLAYCIEGFPSYRPATLIGGIPFKNLMAHLDHLQIRDHIGVIYSAASGEACAERIVQYAMNYYTLPAIDNTLSAEPNISHSIPPNTAKLPDYLSIVKHHTQQPCIPHTMWEKIPCVGSVLASVLACNTTIADVYNRLLGWEHIAQLRFPHGAFIGEHRARKIVSSVAGIRSAAKTSIAWHTKLLANIRGVSIKTAAAILQQCTLADIIEQKINVDMLAAFDRGTGNTQIGKNLAEQIIAHVCCTMAISIDKCMATNECLPDR